jgi:carbamoyltransferase
MSIVLGVSAFYHDSAAALVIDGQIIAAAQEERFSRKKHDDAFPSQAIEFCLQYAGLTPSDLDYVAYYEKPIRRFERLLETSLSWAPFGYQVFRSVVPRWLHGRLNIPGQIRQHLGDSFRGRIVFPEHHESHAASAFFASPFLDAAIVTMDGVGEWATATIGQGRGNRIELTHELRFPHSPGLLYSAFTSYLGFRVNSGEYKVMGLAPYGKPVYRDAILKHLMAMKDDGSFVLDMDYFRYCHGLTMTSGRFHRLLGGPPRTPESPLTQRHCDLAASIQSVTEDIMLRMTRFAQKQTRAKNLVLAGGVALNCVGNGRIHREVGFERMFVQPAAGDAGGSLGAALFVSHQLLNHPRDLKSPDAQKGSLLGPEFTDDQIQAALQKHGAVFRVLQSNSELCDVVATQIADGKVVGWFQGRMEFGPRALGNRSILADARNPQMRSLLNEKIKLREPFRPFAAAVLREQVHSYFQLAPDTDSPFMLLVSHVQDHLRLPTAPVADYTVAPAELLDSRAKSVIPGVTHVDYSSRIQTVDRDRNPLFHDLLQAFAARTGCSVLINTSFNVRGEPIVCTPEDAVQGFLMTEIDVLAIGRCVLFRNQQPHIPEGRERADFLRRIPAD